MGWLCVPCWDFSLLEAAIFPCWDCSVLEADWRLAGLAEFVMFEFGCMRFSVEDSVDVGSCWWCFQGMAVSWDVAFKMVF